ncbi:hypothetical protein [Sphingomonas sp. LT1P40]|uniref:hypothetical protein n=1 Tax=Alteristakelama amylovorans TaxID=3096166 RepID=UPI002FC9BD6F
MEQRATRHSTMRNMGLAVALALLLTAVWAARDWAALSALQLPDTDDMMRLQQIRDWVGGQAFYDLAQHRLGLAGLEMHWSRLPDLVPAAIVALLAPLLGGHIAELAAVLLWPALLFVAALALIGSIARVLDVSAQVAIVVAALAYPASALFVPGRIDHHGLQLVLLLVLVRAVLGEGGWRAGVAAGLASAASLAVGLETAPLLAIGGGVIVWRWIMGEDDRMAGYATALFGGLLLAALTLRTSGWDYPACDGFDAMLWRAAQIAAAAPVLLAAAGRWIAPGRGRLLAALVIGGVAMAAALAASPGCLSPYGEVDPLLARLWLSQVAEAQPLFGASLVHAIGYAGLLFAGLAATALMWRRERREAWLILGAFQIVSLALMLLQLRGAYAGAMLAAPALAGLIAVARARGPLPLAAAWIVSAGFVYPMLGGLMTPSTAGKGAGCDPAPALARLAALPAGRVAASVDFGAYALAGTGQQMLAAPYHRNANGILSAYRLFVLPDDRAAAYAARLDIAHVVYCPGGLPELGEPKRGTGRAILDFGRTPGWLTRLSPADEAMAVYAVRRAP